MYASHTLIAYPIVIRYGINRQRAVSIAVGGTAVTDTLTLLVLAVVGGMYKGETSEMFWIWLVLKVVVLSVVIMYAFPRIGRWFFPSLQRQCGAVYLCNGNWFSSEPD